MRPAPEASARLAAGECGSEIVAVGAPSPGRRRTSMSPCRAISTAGGISLSGEIVLTGSLPMSGDDTHLVIGLGQELGFSELPTGGVAMSRDTARMSACATGVL
jgi:hypothetical protein